MNESTWLMVNNAMNTINKLELHDFIKNFDNPSTGFSLCTDPRIYQIYGELTMDGHSGSSFALTMRNCQYYLNNPNKWIEVQQQYNTTATIQEEEEVVAENRA
jgi:hypothetical protein